MKNHALDSDKYSRGPTGDFGDDFGDFGAGGNDHDPWYSKSPNTPSSAYSQDMSPAYASNEGMNTSYTGRFDLDEKYDDEPPLLEELGIHFAHIWAKTQAVLVPNKVCFRASRMIRCI